MASSVSKRLILLWPIIHIPVPNGWLRITGIGWLYLIIWDSLLQEWKREQARRCFILCLPTITWHFAPGSHFANHKCQFTLLWYHVPVRPQIGMKGRFTSLTPRGQMKDVLWLLLTQNYNLIKTAAPSHLLSPVLLQKPLANSAFWQLRSCSAASPLICFLAELKRHWLAVRRPEFWSWLCTLKSIWLNVGHLELSLFPRVQNKENDPFPSPAELAGFLWSSEAVKNLKSLSKIENSLGRIEGSNTALFIP